MKDRKALVTGIANAHSIAYGCAKAFRELEAPIYMPLDVSKEKELDAVFARIEKEWGRLDILVHSIA